MYNFVQHSAIHRGKSFALKHMTGGMIMATNHTANYNLNQWEATDPVLRTDFNADNSKVDAALKSLSTTVQQHTTQISQMQTALSKCGTCKFHYQTYAGNGESSWSLTFPSKPVLIFISIHSGQSIILNADAEAAVENSNGVSLSWSGNTLTLTNKNQYSNSFNQKDNSYLVLALYDTSQE